MNRPYQIITFDVYTALFDIENSLLPRVIDALGVGVDGLTLIRTWRAKQLEYALISNSLAGQRISFRVITGRSLDYALGRTGVDLTEVERDGLVMAWHDLQPWPEANDVLSTVKALGFSIGMLSNGDHAGLSALQQCVNEDFDYVFSSERAGHYKPHPSVYALPLEELGIDGPQILHVAGSTTDAHGTKSAGLPCYWSNRRGDLVLDAACKPDYEFGDLNGLIGVLHE